MSDAMSFKKFFETLKKLYPNATISTWSENSPFCFIDGVKKDIKDLLK